MGSACHQGGVYWVHPALEQLLNEYAVADLVDFKGSLCLGPCKDRIVIRVGDELVLNVTPDNLKQKFMDEILPRIAQP
jgi:NADH:ubiquinone oxidoreductase subunit E